MSRRSEFTISFDTLGCAKNGVDTSKMIEQLIKQGYNVTNNFADADAIILNTCSFIEAAAQESIDTFFDYRKSFKDKKIIVCGCLVSRYAGLPESMPEADAFISCKDENSLFKVLDDLFNIENPKPTKKPNFNTLKNGSYAYVKISDGCNRMCSYCAIPFIRGRYKSTPYSEIYKDVEKCAANDIKEIVLVAQDCGVWGSDLENHHNLAWLINKLCSDFNDVYFRVLYIQPDAINEELLEAFKSNDNMLKYFDIPMQHCNERILNNMNRKGYAKSYLHLIKTIRSAFEKCIVRSTLIAGFPGETENEFNELYNFLQEADMDYVGVFEFSPEEGTKAFIMTNQIDDDTRRERANTLRDLSDKISLQKIDNKIGTVQNVLIEGEEEGRVYGRIWSQAPEVDGVVFLDNWVGNLEIGTFVRVKIIDTELYDLVGEVLDD